MIYRAYDIRGTVGKDLTAEIALLIGQAFGSTMRESGYEQVAVGRDNRPSSSELEQALTSGIRRAGVNTVSIGEVPTPVLYHYCVQAGTKPGIMITGSHLPPTQNGFKMTVGLSPFYGEAILRLKERVEQKHFLEGSGLHTTVENAQALYFEDVAARFKTPMRRLKIVVDAGNGMAGSLAPRLLRALGHEVIELFCESDGLYPNHPADPSEEENLHDLQKMIVQQQADLGLAFDGDADRVGIVDHVGQAHSTDRVMIPLIWDILKKQPGATIITDPLVSSVLIEAIRQAGGTPLMWKSGHSHIKSKMQEVKAAFALETSGHVFIAENYYGYDDGIYTALRLVEVLAQPDMLPLAQIMPTIPVLHTTPQYRPHCAEEKKAAVIEAVHQHFHTYEVSAVDGVRVTLPGGWFILRASNTEPKLSLRFEGEKETIVHEMLQEVRMLLNQHGVEL